MQQVRMVEQNSRMLNSMVPNYHDGSVALKPSVPSHILIVLHFVLQYRSRC